MPRGRRKNPEKHTPQEAVAYVLRWAERCGYDSVPAFRALREKLSAEQVQAVVEWAEQQNFRNVAAHLRQRALPQ